MTQHAWVQVARQQPIPCMIVNISTQGALLEFNCMPPTANRFRLRIDEEGFEALCDVRHRSFRAIGVYLTGMEPTQTLKANASGDQLVREIRLRQQMMDNAA